MGRILQSYNLAYKIAILPNLTILQVILIAMENKSNNKKILQIQTSWWEHFLGINKGDVL